jgi:hypothetical protein
MNYFKGTKTQISPCIAAKAKFALELSHKEPSNIKTCSYNYWCAVIESLSKENKLTATIVENAKNQFKILIKK